MVVPVSLCLPSLGSPGLSGTEAQHLGTSLACRTAQTGCSGWQPPSRNNGGLTRLETLRSRIKRDQAGRPSLLLGASTQPLPAPSSCPPPCTARALTEGCSMPSACSRMSRASLSSSVASLYLFWSLREEKQGTWGAAGGSLQAMPGQSQDAVAAPRTPGEGWEQRNTTARTKGSPGVPPPPWSFHVFPRSSACQRGGPGALAPYR